MSKNTHKKSDREISSTAATALHVVTFQGRTQLPIYLFLCRKMSFKTQKVSKSHVENILSNIFPNKSCYEIKNIVKIGKIAD